MTIYTDPQARHELAHLKTLISKGIAMTSDELYQQAIERAKGDPAKALAILRESLSRNHDKHAAAIHMAIQQVGQR